MIRTAILAALVLVCATLPSEARQRHRVASCIETGDIMRPTCGTQQAASGGFLQGVRSINVTMHRERVRKRVERVSETAADRASGSSIAAPPPRYGVPTTSWMETTVYSQAKAHVAAQVVGGRPAGCPSRFCGCGASLHLFGRIIPSLNLAANWLRFPRAAPAPKMAAARRGHVFILEQHISGDVWLVHDSNSGGHRTRLHARSIAGYAIVDPHGAG